MHCRVPAFVVDRFECHWFAAGPLACRRNYYPICLWIICWSHIVSKQQGGDIELYVMMNQINSDHYIHTNAIGKWPGASGDRINYCFPECWLAWSVTAMTCCIFRLLEISQVSCFHPLDRFRVQA